MKGLSNLIRLHKLKLTEQQKKLNDLQAVAQGLLNETEAIDRSARNEAAGADSIEQLESIARGLSGHLTATIHGTDKDLEDHRELLEILETKVGRLVFNGFPTGIEVCPAMHHGGPYPATTDGHFTSIGPASILRFVRPLCYQGFPQSALPQELRDENTGGVWRLLDNELTKDDYS